MIEVSGTHEYFTKYLLSHFSSILELNALSGGLIVKKGAKDKLQNIQIELASKPIERHQIMENLVRDIQNRGEENSIYNRDGYVQSAPKMLTATEEIGYKGWNSLELAIKELCKQKVLEKDPDPPFKMFPYKIKEHAETNVKTLKSRYPECWGLYPESEFPPPSMEDVKQYQTSILSPMEHLLQGLGSQRIERLRTLAQQLAPEISDPAELIRNVIDGLIDLAE
jgi:hypothetical protein